MARISLWILSLLCLSSIAHAKTQSFKEFIEGIKEEASREGISRTTIDILSSQSKPFKKLGSKNQRLATEEPLSVGTYLTSTITNEKLEKLRQFHSKYRSQISDIAQHYKVQPRFILATWAVVSNVGQSNSGYPVLSIYASKAYNSNTKASKKQLYAALKTIDGNKLDIQDFRSDHLGRIGLLSFTPILYQQYAQDWDKDGKYDIWRNNLDSLATVANFLNKNGWSRSQTWGRQVALKQKFTDKSLYGKPHSFVFWSERGVTRYNGSSLPNRSDIQATLFQPLAKDNRHYLVYDNFKILTQWPEIDDKRALAISYLSEKLKPIIRKK